MGKTSPTVWLLEGLVMYLTDVETRRMMRCIGRLSAPGSVVFHDAISQSNLTSGIVVAGARFVGGSDDYAGMWSAEAGFRQGKVRSIDSVWVDRRSRSLYVDERPWMEATEE